MISPVVTTTCSLRCGFEKKPTKTNTVIPVHEKQPLVAEKDAGLQKLNAATEQGERLSPDTAASGRDAVRQELRGAKDAWDALVADLSEVQQQAEATAAQVRREL